MEINIHIFLMNLIQLELITATHFQLTPTITITTMKLNLTTTFHLISLHTELNKILVNFITETKHHLKSV